MSVDVADRAALARTLEQMRRNNPPLRGIFHLAGVLADGIIHNQTAEQIAKVFHAKVHGGWNLHQLTQQDNLDYFVLFSSVASMLGSGGQSNYAAANAFLDGLARYRKSLAQPALAINWGPISHVGMAAERFEQQKQLAKGMKWITPDEAFRSLGKLLNNPAADQVGVFAMDWQTALAETDPETPWLSEVRPKGQKRKDTPLTHRDIGSELSALDEKSRTAHLRAYIDSQVRSVLKWPDDQHLAAEQGFFDLGMDSLMSVELAHRLQRDLGASLATTDIFDYPTIERLTLHILNRLNLGEAAAIRVSAPDTAARPEPEPQSESVAVVGIGCRFPGGA
ncbi:MAG: beta-ketoacyl reductase, partial [Terriglobales bacterium]